MTTDFKRYSLILDHIESLEIDGREPPRELIAEYDELHRRLARSESI